MPLCAKNEYQIHSAPDFSEKKILDLFTCYQPCIGAQALSFYLTLVSESRMQRGKREHTRLCRLCGFDIKQIEDARIKCEQFALLKTYVNQDESCYVYELLAPLSAKEFMMHDVFGRLYLSFVGSKDTELTNSYLFQPLVSLNSYSDVSASFDASFLKNWDIQKEQEFSVVKADTQPMIEHNGFDLNSFLSLSSNLTFPYQARTKENLELICDLGALYGISEERMRILVGHSINNSTQLLNCDMLRRMASLEKNEVQHEPKNKYDLPPVVFLQNIQGGVVVTQVDKRLLEYLMRDLHFSPEIVNVLIEYVLKINENRLTRSFVESVASSWIRNKVSTLEQALQMTEVKPVKRAAGKSVRKASLPKYMENTAQEVGLDDDEERRLLQALSRLEE